MDMPVNLHAEQEAEQDQPRCPLYVSAQCEPSRPQEDPYHDPHLFCTAHTLPVLASSAGCRVCEARQAVSEQHGCIPVATERSRVVTLYSIVICSALDGDVGCFLFFTMRILLP